MQTQELVLTPPPEHTPTEMDLLSIALRNNAAIDVIERLAALQDKAMARKAEVYFNEALNRVQSEIKRVAPDLDNPQTKSRYASYGALDRVIRPIYSKEGFSLSFDTADTDKPDTVRVVCYVALGAHTRRYQIDMPADGKGAKGGDVMTKTHATGSAMSYGMRYLVKGIFNVAVAVDDNDGNLPGDMLEKIEFLKNCCTKVELTSLFKKYYAEHEQDKAAKLALIDAYEARKKDL